MFTLNAQVMLRVIPILLFYFFIRSVALAAFLGEVDQVQNLPGYIDLTGKTYIYRGIKTSKIRGVAERRTPSKILSTFISGNQFDENKFDQLIRKLIEFKQSIRTTYCMEKYADQLNSYQDCTPEGELNLKLKSKLKKKWKKNKFKLALDFAIENLKRAKKMVRSISLDQINFESSQEFLELFFSAYEVYQGIRAEDEQQGSRSFVLNQVVKAKDFFQKNIIRAGRKEASNLLVPDELASTTQNYFLSPAQLAKFEDKGGDISRLEPPSSGLWRKPEWSIRDFDTSNYHRQGIKQLSTILDAATAERILDHDDEMSVVYKPHLIKGGQTPKFNVYLNGVKFKLKFITNGSGYAPQKAFFNRAGKYIWGSEVGHFGGKIKPQV